MSMWRLFAFGARSSGGKTGTLQPQATSLDAAGVGSGCTAKISMLRESAQVKNTFLHFPDQMFQEVLTHWALYRVHPEAPLCREDDCEVAAHSPVRSLRRHGRHPPRKLTGEVAPRGLHQAS